MIEFLKALFLGFVEGLTEFIPVSSTGHLVVFAEWLKYSSPGHVFEVFIQLGAILAVIILYRKKIFETVRGIGTDKTAQKFSVNVIVATLPALVIGALFHHWIKDHLYTPVVIAWAFIIGGVILLLLEKRLQKPKIQKIDDIPFKTAVVIGLVQTLALIPGVSRSGATIMGALGLGLARPAAAEFSFFLAIPVLIAASAFDMHENWDALMHYPDFYLLFVGFFAAFLTSLATLKAALYCINRWGFAPFAWYRIVVGIAVLLLAGF